MVKGVPVLAGVCATDPFRRMEYFLRQLETIGFCGVQNFPTVGLFDGNFRQNLEETGMGYRYTFYTFQTFGSANSPCLTVAIMKHCIMIIAISFSEREEHLLEVALT